MSFSGCRMHMVLWSIDDTIFVHSTCIAPPGATMVGPDVFMCAGVVHVIDQVLLSCEAPPAPPVVADEPVVDPMPPPPMNDIPAPTPDEVCTLLFDHQRRKNLTFYRSLAACSFIGIGIPARQHFCTHNFLIAIQPVLLRTVPASLSSEHRMDFAWQLGLWWDASSCFGRCPISSPAFPACNSRFAAHCAKVLTGSTDLCERRYHQYCPNISNLWCRLVSALSL